MDLGIPDDKGTSPPMNDEDSLTPFEAETAGLFLNFFIGLFNTILYKRAEYKKSTFFFSREIFNLELAFTFHPHISRYIEDCSKRAASFVLQNSVNGLQLNLLNATNIVVQRFILKLEGKWTWTKGRYSDEEDALRLESVRAGLKKILVRLNDPNVSSTLPHPVGSVDRFIITFGFGSQVSFDSHSNIIDAALLLEPDVYEFPWTSLKKTRLELPLNNDAGETTDVNTINDQIKEVGICQGGSANQKALTNGAGPNKTLNDCKPLIPSLFPVESAILAKSLVFNFYVLTYPKEDDDDIDEENDREEVVSPAVKAKKSSSSVRNIPQDKTQREMRDEELLKRLDGPSNQFKSHNNQVSENSGGQLDEINKNMPAEAACNPMPIAAANASTDLVPSSSASGDDTPAVNRAVKRKSSPDRLLQCLSGLLDPTSGAIKSEEAVPTMISVLKCYDQLTSSIMSKFSRKLMNKCIFINVLNSTASVKLMNTFLQNGGWSILHRWTKEGIEKHNNQLLAEVFMLLLKIHVTPSLLRENNLRDLVKLTTSINADETVKSIALRICATWDIILNQGRLAANSSHFTECNPSGLQRQDAEVEKHQNLDRMPGTATGSQNAGSSSQVSLVVPTAQPSGHLQNGSDYFGSSGGLLHGADGTNHHALEKNVWSTLSLQPDLAEIPADYLTDYLPSSGNDDQSWNTLDADLVSEVSNADLVSEVSNADLVSEVNNADLVSEVSNAIMGIQNSSSSSASLCQGSPSKAKPIPEGITIADDFGHSSTAECDIFPELSRSNWVNNFLVSPEIETAITETLSKMSEPPEKSDKTRDKLTRAKYSDPKLHMRPIVYMEHVKIKPSNSPLKISQISKVAVASGKQKQIVQTAKKPRSRTTSSWRKPRKKTRKIPQTVKQSKTKTATAPSNSKPPESNSNAFGSHCKVITKSDNDEVVAECVKSKTEAPDECVKAQNEASIVNDKTIIPTKQEQTKEVVENIPEDAHSTKELIITENTVATHETVPTNVDTPHTEVLQTEMAAAPSVEFEETGTAPSVSLGEAAQTESSPAISITKSLTVEQNSTELISTSVLTDNIIVPVPTVPIPEEDKKNAPDNEDTASNLPVTNEETKNPIPPVEDEQPTIDKTKGADADVVLPTSLEKSEPIFWLKEVRLVRLKPEKIRKYLNGRKVAEKKATENENVVEESGSDVSVRRSWRQSKPKVVFEPALDSPKSRSPVKLSPQKKSPGQFSAESSGSSQKETATTDIMTTLTESQAKTIAMCILSSGASISSRSSSTSTITLSERNSSPSVASEPPRKQKVPAISAEKKRVSPPNGPIVCVEPKKKQKPVTGAGIGKLSNAVSLVEFPEGTKKSKSVNVPQTKNRLPSLSNRKKLKLSAEDIETKKRDELVLQVEKAKESLMRAKSKNLAKAPAEENEIIMKRFKRIEVISEDAIEASSAQKEKSREVSKTKEAEPVTPAPSENVKPTKPNKNASFIDMIGIPGAVDSIKIKPVSKIVPSHTESQQNSTTPSPMPLNATAKDIPSSQISPTAENTEKVKNMPKVYKTKRSRADGLLDEMIGDTEEASAAAKRDEKEAKESADVEREEARREKKHKHRHKSVILPLGPNNLPLQDENGSKMDASENLIQDIKDFSKLKRKSDEEADRQAGEKKIMKFTTPFDSIDFDFTFVKKEDVDALTHDKKDVKKSSSESKTSALSSSKEKRKEDKISVLKQKAEQDYQRRMESQPKNFHSTIVNDLVEGAGASPDANVVSSTSAVSSSTAKAPASSALSRKNAARQESCIFDIVLNSQAMDLNSYRRQKVDKHKKKMLERRKSKESSDKAKQPPKEDLSTTAVIENENVATSSSSSKLDGSKGILVLVRDEQRKRKTLRWKADSELVTLHEFELDASERVNVTRKELPTFSQMQKQEMEKEKTMIIMINHAIMSKDQQVLWIPPRLIDFPPGKPQPPNKSKERAIQKEREKRVLVPIYFWKQEIPRSPAEPDPEDVEKTTPIIIPTGSKKTRHKDFTGIPFFGIGNMAVETPMVDSTTSNQHRHEKHEVNDRFRRMDRDSYVSSPHSSTSSRSPYPESGSFDLNMQNDQRPGPSRHRKSRWGNSYDESFEEVTEQTSFSAPTVPAAAPSPHFPIPPSPYPYLFPEQTYPDLPGYLQTDPRYQANTGQQSTPPQVIPDYHLNYTTALPPQVGVLPVLFPPGEVPPSPVPYQTTFFPPQPVPPPPVPVPSIPQSLSKETSIRPPAIVPPPTILNTIAPPPAGYSRQPFRMTIGPRQRPPLKRN